jgi:hypothetical protein
MALDMGLSIGTGIVADQVRRRLIQSGKAPAIIAGLVAGAGIKAVAEGGITLIDNARHDRALTTDLASHMVDGVRTGTIDGALSFAAAPIHRTIGSRLPGVGTVGLAAASGLVVGALGGTAYSATDRKTWSHGVKDGLTSVAVSTAFGAGAGAAMGGVAGAVVKRFFPAYQPGAAKTTEAQVRSLVIERGTSKAEAAAPAPEGGWADAVANAKKVSTVKVTRSATFQQLRRSNPELKAFIQELQPGDVVLIGKGNLKTPTGDVAWPTKSPYTHAMLVTEAAQGSKKGGAVIHATFSGVYEERLGDAMGMWMPHGGRPKSVFTVIRPSKDPAIAQAAIAHARGQLHKPYNWSMERGNDAQFCSQLIYNAYEANPAIPNRPLKLLQLDVDQTRMDALRGVGKNGALWTIFERKSMDVYKEASTGARLKMMATDGLNLVKGALSYGAGKVKGAVSETGGKTYATDYRYQHPEFVSPGDFDLADGRKLHTLVMEARPGIRRAK